MVLFSRAEFCKKEAYLSISARAKTGRALLLEEGSPREVKNSPAIAPAGALLEERKHGRGLEGNDGDTRRRAVGKAGQLIGYLCHQYGGPGGQYLIVE
jgi:hypothetical protein